MHKNYLKTFIFIFFLILISPIYGEAQLFGSEEENWKRIFISLKKLNVRLSDLETSEMYKLQKQNEDLLLQLEEIKEVIPQLMGVVEAHQDVSNSNSEKIIKRLEAIEERLTVF